MARDLGEGKNTLRVKDNLGGGIIELYYRMPTTDERVGYANASVRRVGKKVVVDIAASRIKYGRKILTGFKTGAFAVNGKVFASDPDDPAYQEDWKDKVCEKAPDVLDLLAGQVFDGSVTVAGADDEDDEDDGVEDGAIDDGDPEKN